MKVKVKIVEDDESTFFYNARSLELKPRSKSISTPFRVLTNGDLNAKAKMPSEIALPSPISGIQKQLTQNDVNKILNENKYSEGLIGKLENELERMQLSQIGYPLIYPAQSAISKILVNDRIKNTFLRRLFSIQHQAKMPMLSVPWLDYTPEKAIAAYKTIINSTEEELIFFIPAKIPPTNMEKISKFLVNQVETERIQSIGILYEPVRKAIGSYDILWEYFKDQNVALLLSDITRYNPNLNNISPSHLNEFIIGDLFMPKVYAGGGSNKKELHVASKLRVFNKKTLTVNPIERYSEELWINDVLANINDQHIETKLRNYQEAENNSEKYNILNSIAKVHEFVSSSEEFKNSQEFIAKNEIPDYINEREILKESLKSTKGIQKKITNF
jgi:hypothetical protein